MHPKSHLPHSVFIMYQQPTSPGNWETQVVVWQLVELYLSDRYWQKSTTSTCYERHNPPLHIYLNMTDFCCHVITAVFIDATASKGIG